MKKIAILTGLALLLLPGVFSYATEKKVTLTTYYPAPYGEYQEVKSDKIAVGSTTQQPANSGNVVLKAQSGDPATKTGDFFDGVDGEVAYSATNDNLYVYNGSAWNSATGGGGGACYTWYTNMSSYAVGASCPVTGFTIKANLGSYGWCGAGPCNTNVNTYPLYSRPPGGTCQPWHTSCSNGYAYLCCNS